MEFDLNDDERQLRDEARRFLEREAPIGYARAMLDDERGWDPETHKRMAALGWTALPFGEAHGGLGMGFIPLALLVAEMGRVTMPGPYLWSMLAGLAIERFGSDEQRARLLPGIAAGETLATVAHDAGLEGTARFVPDGATADIVVAIARHDDAPLFIAEPSARTPVETMDRTRRHAHLTFDSARAERLGESDHRAVEWVLDRAAVLLSGEMLGAAERVTELCVEYAKQREQFGRPIGSFQAVKHRLADMLVDVESARNAVYYAAWAADRDIEDASLAASMAKSFCGDAAVRVAKAGIQVHGGIGFTWEHDMHLFFKRITVDAASLGDAAHHRERIAQLLRARLRA